MRKRSAYGAAATGFLLCESVVHTERQQQGFFVRKRSAYGAAATGFLCAKA
ncbi:hypothetical protein [Lysinibacillus sp. G4S2]|uniref:hypothetical protein n=1 Tax=Lysinibacillus sp. G4S2 TaxID=3055859 RepID=UPI0025A12CF9|nr:hypothetical protein [Lysinibacillus sp. G4S2]MDM5249966.1 hypothetical protein [Lysinibacillus sp. G4S2]